MSTQQANDPWGDTDDSAGQVRGPGSVKDRMDEAKTRTANGQEACRARYPEPVFNTLVDQGSKLDGETRSAKFAEWFPDKDEAAGFHRIVQEASDVVEANRLTQQQKQIDDALSIKRANEAAANTLRRENQERRLSGDLTESQESLSKVYVAKVVKRAAIRDMPEPVPVIDGLLFLDSLSWIAGDSGSYKSFVALDMVGHYASDLTSFHGLEVSKGKALIVIGEGVSGFGKRIDAWEAFNQCDWPDDADFFPEAIQVNDDDPLAALRHTIIENGYSLVVLDTQAMMTVGLDENNAQDMGRFVSALHSLRVATGACILVVHHFSKTSNNMRGSGAMYAAATTVITTKRDGANGQVVLSTLHKDNGKQKDAEEREYLPLVMQTVAGSLAVTAPMFIDGDQTARVVIDIDERRYTRMVLRHLSDVDVWGGSNTSLKKWIEEETGGSLGSKTVPAELNKMLKEQLLSGTRGAIKVTPLGRRMLEG